MSSAEPRPGWDNRQDPPPVSIHEQLLSQSPNAAIYVSATWMILFANDRAAALVHKTAKEISGRDFWATFPEFANSDSASEFRRALKDKVEIEFEHTTPSGSWLWVCAAPDSEGVAIFSRDITKATLAERATLLLGAIVDSSDDAIISKDLNGVITSWNKSAERIFGHTALEAVGQTVAALLIPDDRQEEEPHILARLRKGERVDHFETKRKHKDGRLVDISLTISPIKDAHGRIIGASKIARDISEQVKRKKALESANNALKRANTDLEYFAYSASHDLQEPLRMVSTYGEMLLKKYGTKLDERANEYISYIVDGGNRMERLLHNLRAFTQIATTEYGPPPIVESEHVLKSTLAGLKSLIDETRAEVSFDSLPGVRVHEFQMEQIFQNILVNAIRYRSTAPPKIHVSAEREEKDWKFSIRDNGIGINPEYKEQIFGIFKRLHSSSDVPGSGLGLSICQRIVERAGGKIWVESELGRGSTFFFILPGE